MLKSRSDYVFKIGALLFGFTLLSPHASADAIQTVFVIAMENHNWTQPAQAPGGIQQLYGNPNAA